MNQLDFHNQSDQDVRDFSVPILAKFNEAYKLWHSYLIHLPKITRFTLGNKIDTLFTTCLEQSLKASYQSKDTKIETIAQLNNTFDTLKFFLKLLWEIKELDTNKMTALSVYLIEIGKMIGGWIKWFKKTPPTDVEGEQPH